MTEAISSDAHGSTALQLEIYAQHTLYKDYIGGIKENIETLLTDGKAGRKSCSFAVAMVKLTCASAVSRGFVGAGGTTAVIKFVIADDNGKVQTITELGELLDAGVRPDVATGPIGESATISKDHLSEVVAKATEAVGQMSMAPVSEDAVNTLGAVVDRSTTIAVLWEPFLGKVELFVKVLDQIAEVRNSG